MQSCLQQFKQRSWLHALPGQSQIGKAGIDEMQLADFMRVAFGPVTGDHGAHGNGNNMERALLWQLTANGVGHGWDAEWRGLLPKLTVARQLGLPKCMVWQGLL
ncbi:hypothetical protein GCM10011297_11820 [Bacterioplanes sanyensis]|nr:hypothetical protein GCM10011297_11820 [Bacterioplanes sanyensis]